eukprot:TRINITY_DN2042_c0_g1_i2.p1 TRINITY_DN2042_c0_g1~~TRINITY_DN2042_c0_g1_i2.p1  ORF type:complete len:440 (-),score=90.47 TRINITY_DN2042_c0_g1_i2:61-1356(-)
MMSSMPSGTCSSFVRDDGCCESDCADGCSRLYPDLTAPSEVVSAPPADTSCIYYSFSPDKPYPASYSPNIVVGSFIISPDTATNAVQDKINEFWLLPTGFKKRFTCPSLSRTYYPFLIYNVQAHVDMTCSIKGATPEWRTVQKNYKEQIDSIVVCACASAEDRDLVANLGVIPPVPSSLTQQVMHELAGKQGATVSDALHWMKVWTDTTEPATKKRAEDSATSLVQIQEKATAIKDVKSTTSFKHLECKLIYFPFYTGSYLNDDGKTYRVIVDGQSASLFVERPGYGLGKAGDLVKGTVNLFSTMLAWREEVAIMMGSRLAETDYCAALYCPENAFLTFPRSDSYGVTQSIGLVTVINSGREEVVVQGQKRKGAKRGACIAIPAREERTLPFRGWWCLEVVSGRWEDVTIKQCLTNGGSGPDEGLMCHKEV